MTDEGGGTPDDEAAMRTRLARLSGALDARRKSEGATRAAAEKRAAGSSSGYAMGMRAASELVAGVLVGGVIGWQLDAWLGTRPWLMILFFLLGVAGAFWNIIRTAMKPTEKPARDDPSKGPEA